jgi:Tfp pilus assembly protein PilF
MIRRTLSLSVLVFTVAISAASAQSTVATTSVDATAAAHFHESQAFAAANNPQAALAAVEEAVKLEPQNPDYLRAHATIATWVGDYRRAQDSYRRLALLQPDDAEITLAYARVSAWGGDTNAAVDSFRNYLTLRPDTADAWLELARTESWRGNYAAAVEALDTYKSHFGVSAAYSRELAAVMTGNGSPNRAEAVLTPLLRQTPEDYELSVTHTIALAMQRRSREAFASLDNLRRLGPDRRETRDAARVLRTLLASSADAQVTVYGDSDRLQTQAVAPSAAVALRSGTRFSAGYIQTRLDARRGSGLDTRSGSSSARYEQTWASVAQKIGRVTLGGEAGYAKANAHDRNTYMVSADVRAGDRLQFLLERTDGLFIVSPRTVDMRLTQAGERLYVDWSPTLRSHVVWDSSYQELSDGNTRWNLTLSPRRSFARTAKFNLDLGLSAYQLHTERNLDNGYYDPRLYEQYSATAFPYFKFTENIGLGLMAAVGAQREGRSNDFAPGGTLTTEATVGIYQPWVLKVIGSSTINRRLETGAFQGFSGSVVLVRRF